MPNLYFGFAILSLALLSGCHAQNRAADGNSDVLIRTTSTTRPIEALGADSSARHVELTVHDATSAGIGQSLIGHQCTVQLRRDALGMAGNSPLGATQQWGGNNRVAVSGKITDMTDQWLVLEPASSGHQYCIPHASILLIDVEQ
jgi:hypothetical protein